MKIKGFQAWHLDLLVWVSAISALVACGTLEYLTEYKAGVMRHLYYRKMEHLGSIYSSDMLIVHIVVAVAFLFYALFKACIRGSLNRRAASLFILPTLFLLSLYSLFLQDLYTYSYILISLEAGMVGHVLMSLAGDRFLLRSRSAGIHSD